MKKFFIAMLMAAFCMSAMADDDDFNGGDQMQGQLQLQGQHQTAIGGSGGNAYGHGYGYGEGGDAEGGDAYNEGNNANVSTQMALEQDIDLTENSLVTVAPGLSANGVTCNMESSSYSILIWSKGSSKCEADSKMWRDIENIVKYAAYMGLDKVSVKAVVLARACKSRTMRKALKAVGTDCKMARYSPEKRARITARREHFAAE